MRWWTQWRHTLRESWTPMPHGRVWAPYQVGPGPYDIRICVTAYLLERAYGIASPRWAYLSSRLVLLLLPLWWAVDTFGGAMCLGRTLLYLPFAKSVTAAAVSVTISASFLINAVNLLAWPWAVFATPGLMYARARYHVISRSPTEEIVATHAWTQQRWMRVCDVLLLFLPDSVIPLAIAYHNTWRHYREYRYEVTAAWNVWSDADLTKAYRRCVRGRWADFPGIDEAVVPRFCSEKTNSWQSEYPSLLVGRIVTLWSDVRVDEDDSIHSLYLHIPDDTVRARFLLLLMILGLTGYAVGWLLVVLAPVLYKRMRLRSARQMPVLFHMRGEDVGTVVLHNRAPPPRTRRGHAAAARTPEGGSTPTSSTSSRGPPTPVSAASPHMEQRLADARADGDRVSALSDAERRAMSFAHSKRYFDGQLLLWRHSNERDVLGLRLRRSHLVDDAVARFKELNGLGMLQRWDVSIEGEEGLDAGGVRREVYSLLCEAAFHTDACYWTYADVDQFSMTPNPQAKLVNGDYLEFFRFCGQLIGRCVLDRVLVPVHFTRPFYNAMMGVPMRFADLEAVDQDLFKNLQFMRENSVADVFFETFSVTVDEFGEKTVYDLIPNGRDIDVTDENKHRYIDLRARYALLERIGAESNAFMAGFQAIVPPDLLSVFTPEQLELLLCGLPHIDVADWKRNTLYSNTMAEDSVVQAFWHYVDQSTPEHRARLLQFVTGSALVPVGGFAALQGGSGLQSFNIELSQESEDKLPVAHCCFNQLVLPPYSSYDTLRLAFNRALAWGNVGFGIA